MDIINLVSYAGLIMGTTGITWALVRFRQN